MTHHKNKKLEQASNLLNQIIDRATKEDVIHKQKMIALHKGEQAIGESWMVFHLKALRELFEKIEQDS